ncbi:SRPBCC family protein [Nocardioides marinquilinus]|uniref:SRPBCC family protein n=1 Tax=Nocardioides marinquilinus TaxID=1210400 RepID=A0ABP9Q4B4_9ACTN
MTFLEHSRTFPATVEDAYGRVLTVPLEHVFGHRHLAIPAVVSAEPDDALEAWGERVGQRRTLQFSDGGRAVETLTSLDPPRGFGYRLAELHGPMKLLIGRVDGAWRFEPAGTGVRITWSWDVAPTAPGRLAMLGFGPVWQGAARKAFDEIERLLVG